MLNKQFTVLASKIFKSKVTNLGKYAENLGKFDELCHYLILNIIGGFSVEFDNLPLPTFFDSFLNLIIIYLLAKHS